MRSTLLALPLMLAGGPAFAAVPITGHWITDGGKALVLIAPCGDQLCGRVERVLRAPADAPTTDANNPDASLRGRPMVGISILSSFTDSGSDWRGRIYNPEDGKSYKSIVSRNPDGTLKVKGCIAFFCRTQTWRPAR